MKRSRLNQKRPTPRRKAPERVPGRMKPEPGAGPTPEEKAHIADVAKMPCLVLAQPVIDTHRCHGRTTVHHVTSDGFLRIARSPRRVVPLCEKHHLIQHGPHESVERLGHNGFELVYGIDLRAEADRLWQESQSGTV